MNEEEVAEVSSILLGGSDSKRTFEVSPKLYDAWVEKIEEQHKDRHIRTVRQ